MRWACRVRWPDGRITTTEVDARTRRAARRTVRHDALWSAGEVVRVRVRAARDWQWHAVYGWQTRVPVWAPPPPSWGWQAVSVTGPIALH